MVRLLVYLVGFGLSISSATAQILEFSALKKLPPVINSSAEESMPILSPDQTKLFFVRSIYEANYGGKYSGQDIWCSERTESGWKSPTNRFNTLNDRDNNVIIGVGAGGNTLYTLNSSPSVKLEGFYFTKFNERSDKWSRPEFVPLPGIDNQDFVGMYVHPDYDVILLSMRGKDSRGEEDIYYSLKSKDGEWTRPENIGATINTSGFEISPFLSHDKKRIYFASNGHGGLGDADIFYCERLYNSWQTWSAPVNLGPVVNSRKFDAYFSIYGDTVAFFTSNRENQLADIYSVKVSVKQNYLSGGKQYLSQEEWNKLVGKSVAQKLTFPANSKDLSVSQRELLYYMANKIAENKEIGIHLVVREEEDSNLTSRRLREIYGELRQAGIDSNRIREDQLETISAGKAGIIELKLYK